jgi:ABC-type cobalamin/Fe3+-siderophores transport system ATPase subunit
VQALATASGPASIPVLDSSQIRAAVDAQRLKLQGERELLQGAQKEGERAKLETELAGLKALDWCNENVSAVLKEVARLKQIAVLDGAAKLTNTAQVTKKKNELAQEELVGGYRTRFEHELATLGAKRIQVAPVEAGRGAKGRVTFSLAIVGAKKPAQPAQVLSEGEARVVALAAFLADVTVAGARTPFVFDDPVSSLDIEFEERVAERLVALAKVRQVIVFTHRLSLLTLLKEAIKKENAAAKQIENGKAVELKEVALRRLEGRIGLVTEANVLESRVDKALNDLIGKRLAETKKAADAANVETYLALMKGCCSDLRILTERAIEEELLGGVVLRFRRGLVTKDKLTLLAKISVEDCKFLDGLMTRLSSFEHTQPPELPAKLPSLDEVLADANALKTWVTEFRARTVPVGKS